MLATTMVAPAEKQAGRSEMETVIAVKQLVFSHPNQTTARNQPLLNLPSLTVFRGERLFLYGPSGCGKTTLLGLLSGVLAADHGAVSILGTDLSKLRPSERDAFRAAHIGVIFQMFNLIPYCSVIDNILLPTRFHPQRRKQGTAFRKEAERLAESLGLTDLLHTRGDRLSVGQQQRVAAARALIGSPELVIADEPTSALDSDNRRDFLQLLFDQCRRVSATLVLVSHDRSIQSGFDRALDLSTLNKAVAS